MKKSTGLFLAALLLALPGPATAAAPPTVEQLAAEFGLDPGDMEKLRAGKMIDHFPGEVSERDIATGLAFFVKRPAADLARWFLEGSGFDADPNKLSYHKIDAGSPGPSFASVRLAGKTSGDEVKRYLNAAQGDTLNLSAAEIALFRALGSSATHEQVERVLRKMLQARFEAYRGQGLDGTAAYEREQGKQINPGEELKLLMRKATARLEKSAPAFHQALLGYPKSKPAGVEETFYWMVSKLDDRPTVTLRHRMTMPLGDGLVAADREFYVSHGYNVMQAIGAILPVEGGTLVFYRGHTSTDRVAGASSGMKHSIGRKMMAKQIAKLFERSRARAEK